MDDIPVFSLPTISTSFNNSSPNITGNQSLHFTPVCFHITIATLTTIFNAVVIFIYISMERKKEKIPNYLMFYQACVDIVHASMAWYESAAVILLSDAHISLSFLSIVYASKSLVNMF